jgi:tripartite motif-containing protein 71
MPLVPYIPPHIEFLSAFGKEGMAAGEFLSPQGVAVDSSGNVYVADFGNKNVQIFDVSGTFLKVLLEIGPVGPWAPNDVAVDSSNNLYISDDTNSCIWKYDSSWTLVTSFGSYGTSGDYHFNNPTGLAAAGSYLYVADNGNNRIMQFQSSLLPGSYVTQWGSNSPAKITVNAFGYVYVTDYGNNRVQKFDSSGTYVSQWGSPGGKPGSGDGQFDGPLGMALYSTVPLIGPRIWIDYVFVADGNNNRVQMFGIEAD